MRIIIVCILGLWLWSSDLYAQKSYVTFKESKGLRDRVQQLNSLYSVQYQDSILGLIDKSVKILPESFSNSTLIVESYTMDEFISLRNTKVAYFVTDSMLEELKKRGGIKESVENGVYLDSLTGQAVFSKPSIDKEALQESGYVDLNMRRFEEKFKCNFIIERKGYYSDFDKEKFRYVLKTVYRLITDDEKLLLRKDGIIIGWKVIKTHYIYDRYNREYYHAFTKLKVLYRACRD